MNVTHGSTRHSIRRSGIALLASQAVAVTALTVLAAAPASASGGDDDVRTNGSCSGSTDWKMKAKADDARIEVEAEVDSNVVGQTWAWRLEQDGNVVASGQSVTRAPSGSFSVELKPGNGAGTDDFVFRAVNVKSGEVCRGTVAW